MNLDATGESASDSRPHGQRPRAKLALLDWAGAYSVLLLVLALGGPALASWPLALRTLVLSGLMVAAVTWVITPLMTRLFRGWLRDPGADRQLTQPTPTAQKAEHHHASSQPHRRALRPHQPLRPQPPRRVQ